METMKTTSRHVSAKSIIMDENDTADSEVDFTKELLIFIKEASCGRNSIVFRVRDEALHFWNLTLNLSQHSAYSDSNILLSEHIVDLSLLLSLVLYHRSSPQFYTYLNQLQFKFQGQAFKPKRKIMYFFTNYMLYCSLAGLI